MEIKETRKKWGLSIWCDGVEKVMGMVRLLKYDLAKDGRATDSALPLGEKFCTEKAIMPALGLTRNRQS